MTRDEAVAVLKANEAELRRQGVAHAALFGSLARVDSNAASDVDVFVRFAPDVSITLWDYARLKRRVARMLGASRLKVDVIDLDGMSSHVRSSAERDAVYVF